MNKAKEQKTIKVFKFDMTEEKGKPQSQIAVFLSDDVIEKFPKVMRMVKTMSRKHRLTESTI